MRCTREGLPLLLFAVGLLLCTTKSGPFRQQSTLRVGQDREKRPIIAPIRLNRTSKEGSLTNSYAESDEPTSASLDSSPTPADKSLSFTNEPLKVFQEYMAQHSAQALRDESLRDESIQGRKHRKFLLGSYSCPREAGVMMHDFTTALLIAIVTNRTLLWRYHNPHPAWKVQNRQENCDKILRPADWIAAYDEWREVYNLTQPIHVTGVEMGGWNLTILHEKFQYGDTRLVPETVTQHYLSSHLIVPGKLRGLTKNYELWAGLLFLQDVFSYTFLSQLFGFEEDARADAIIRMLYKDDVAFLHGMLFRESFQFTSHIVESVQSYFRPPDESHITIGIHSRHPSQRNDGSNVQREVDCLIHLLETIRSEHVTSSACTVYVMSDRPSSLFSIMKASQEQGCQGVAAEPFEGADDIVDDEHGPWAGAAFFRDLLVVSQARSGFVGYARSSSALVYENMAYETQNEHFPRLPLRCDLGYN